MAHNLAVVEDTSHGVTFQCSKCAKLCEFVHPAYGDPNPVSDNAGGWTTPDNPEIWMGPCND